MEANDLTASGIARLLGVHCSPALLILKGDRSVTWEHAKVLGERFGVTPAAFMG